MSSQILQAPNTTSVRSASQESQEEPQRQKAQKLYYHEVREIIKSYLRQEGELKGVRDLLQALSISINELDEEIGRRLVW